MERLGGLGLPDESSSRDVIMRYWIESCPRNAMLTVVAERELLRAHFTFVGTTQSIRISAGWRWLSVADRYRDEDNSSEKAHRVAASRQRCRYNNWLTVCSIL